MCPFWKRKGAKEHDETVQLVPFCKNPSALCLCFEAAWKLLLNSVCLAAGCPLTSFGEVPLSWIVEMRILWRRPYRQKFHSKDGDTRWWRVHWFSFGFSIFSTKLVLVTSWSVQESRSFRKILVSPGSRKHLSAFLWVCFGVNACHCFPCWDVSISAQNRKTLTGRAKLIEGILVSRTVDMSFSLKFRFHAGKEEETKKTPRSRRAFPD